MPRRPRLIIPGFGHHVTNRGNRKALIFARDPDYKLFLKRLRHYTILYAVRIFSYCLMDNHIHLVAVPPSREALSNLMHDLEGAYAEVFNSSYKLTGHLWQDRFFSCLLDEEHLWNAVRYVELNPVRAGLAQRAEDYPWSSAAAHCGLRPDPLLDPHFPPRGLIPDWNAWLAAGLAPDVTAQIREATHRGIPCASRPFIEQLEKWTGIPLLPRRRGRKPRP